jgi:hypothetical protein
MTSQIKITQLSDIGNGLANTTLVPVVNMAGVPSTQKATVGNIANSILAGAGTTYQNAGVANIAFSVANAAQPNITSVGTLSVNTLKITGGTAGQVLSTDGAGNLSFTTVSGGGSNGLPLANGTSNFDIATADGNVTVTADGETWTFGTNGVLALPNETNIYGNGQFQIDTVGGFQLTSFTDNVGSGAQTWLFDSNGDLTLPDGTILLGDGSGIEYPTSPGYEWDLHSSDGNVYIGSVEDMAYIDTYSPNIGVRLRSNENDWIFGPDGNLTLPGNTFAVNYANGTQVPLGGGGNANTGNVTFDNINIIGTGNLNLQPDPANAGSYLDIFLTSGPDLHLVASANANLILGKDNQANVMTSWDGNAYVQSWDVGTNTQGGVWTFGGDGTTTFPTLTVDLHNGGNQTAQTLQFGDTNQQAIITGPTPAVNDNAQRIIIQGQRGTGTGEGGDVYVWGGDSDVNGGDIKIYAGDADNASAGSGGYVNLAGGDGFDNGGSISLNGGESANGYGGIVNIIGGYGQTDGGGVSLQGGYGYNGVGGNVQISGGGASNGTGSFGNVVLGSASSAWKFDNTGNLTLPANTFAVNYANGTQVPLGGGGGAAGNAGDVQINVAGNIGADSTLRYVDNGGEMTLYADYLNAPGIFTSDIYAGDGTPSNITLTTSIGNATWTFDTDGNLRTPGNVDIYGAINFPQQVSSINWSTYNIELSQYGRINTNVDFFANANTIGALYLKGDGSNISNINASNITNAYSNSNVISLLGDLGGNGIGNVGNIDISGNINFTNNSAVQQGSIVVSPFRTIETVTLSANSQNNATLLTLEDTGNANLRAWEDINLNTYTQTTNNNWKFDASGNLTIPGNISGSGSNGLMISSNGNVTLNSKGAQFIFDAPAGNFYLPNPGGAIVFPDSTVQNTAYTGAVQSSIANGTSNVNIPASNGNVVITANGTANWTFDTTGNLTIPGGGAVWTLGTGTSGLTANFADPYNVNLGLDYTTNTATLAGANSVVIQSNTGANTNQWTFSADGNFTLAGGGGVYQGPGATNFFGAPNSQVSFSDYEGYNQFFSYPGNGAGAGAFIQSSADLININTWQFGADGNLTLPGNLVIAGNTSVFGTDSALIQPSNNLPLLAISSGANGAVSSVWIEDIGNVGTSNIAAVYANPTPGSGIVRIAVGQNGGNAGPNLWDFNANGTTTFPGDLIGNGASPAPSISGFDSANFAGNITGGNISATGNVTAGNIYATNIVAETSFSIQTANFNANVGGRYGVDTTSGAVTSTLPASPATGGAIFFADAGGAFASNNLTINPNGQTIMGASGNMTVSNNNQSFGLFFNGATWRTYN